MKLSCFCFTGKYLYIESSSPSIKGDSAQLKSSLLPPAGEKGYCFSFWYHMFGATVGSLKMFLQTSDPLEKTLVKICMKLVIFSIYFIQWTPKNMAEALRRPLRFFFFLFVSHAVLVWTRYFPLLQEKKGKKTSVWPIEKYLRLFPLCFSLCYYTFHILVKCWLQNHINAWHNECKMHTFSA